MLVFYTNITNSCDQQNLSSFIHLSFPKGTLNDKSHISQTSSETADGIQTESPSTMNPMNKIYTAVLRTPGPIISFTQLNYKGLFRRHTVNSQTGKQLMLKVVEEILKLELGHVETFTIPGNKSQVRRILLLHLQLFLKHRPNLISQLYVIWNRLPLTVVISQQIIWVMLTSVEK